MRASWVHAVAAALAAAGCTLDYFDPAVGAPLHPLCVDEDSDPSVEVSFERDVAAVLGARCARCHTAAGATPIGLEVGGLDLASYAGLRAGGVISGAAIVAPGQPCASLLIQKLSPGPPFGARMPASGPPFLSDEDVQTLHDWIAEGGRDN